MKTGRQENLQSQGGKMRKLLIVLPVIALVAGLLVEGSVLAQSDGDEGIPDYLKSENKVYQKKYNREQFNMTDIDGDGFLSRDELAARPAWAGGFFYGAEDERIATADKNGDGLISFEEAVAQKKWEIAHAGELNKKYGKETLTWYNNKDWLKSHPKAAKKLISNSNWLEDHPQVVKQMYQDRKWLAANPEVSKAVYMNRKWLYNHPKVAKKLYENKEYLADHPEFSKDAQKFFESHPELKATKGDQK